MVATAMPIVLDPANNLHPELDPDKEYEIIAGQP